MRVPTAFHGGINDVLLSGLVLAVADWRRRHRRGAAVDQGHGLLLDLEGHGREEMFADVDLSRTVGWHTSLFPVRLDPGALDLDEAMAGGVALGRLLKSVKEQLRALPNNGLGYGLLRYLNRETASKLAQLPRAADRLQLSRAGGCSRCGGVRRGRRRAQPRRLRSDDAARSWHRGQCAHLRWRRRRNADCDMVVCARAGGRGCGAGSGAELVPCALGAGAACGAARGGRQKPQRSAAGCALASTDRTAGELLSADSRTSCHCRRCRRACCSMRSMMRARRTSIRSS